jgi:SAM-dependent methyltransferase
MIVATRLAVPKWVTTGKPDARAGRLGPRLEVSMSLFSSVDDADAPERLVAFLDHAARAETGIKHYAAAAHGQRRPTRPVLDVGCGAGHDLALLRASGVPCVGVDPSWQMLATAAERLGSSTPLVRAPGDALPFADGSFDGCRIERVLMHVDDPEAVLDEITRCVVPGGLLTVFEPDWTGLVVESDVLAPDASWMANVRHPEAGARLWSWVEAAGWDVLDRVEELSVWSLDTLRFVAGYPQRVGWAIARGAITEEQGRAWIAEQEERARTGSFRATLPKVLIVATKR